MPDVEHLVELAVQLRAIESTSSDARLTAARLDVESWIGPTVRKSIAARALGITPPALARWIREGAVPTVLSTAGRHEVPLETVLALASATRREPGTHARRMRRAVELTTATDDGRNLRLSRAAHSDLGLAYHEVVAQRLDADIVHDARAHLDRWDRDDGVARHVTTTWRDLLARPIPDIAAAITGTDDDAHFLRQTSPFAGALPRALRDRIVDAVQQARP